MKTKYILEYLFITIQICMKKALFLMKKYLVNYITFLADKTNDKYFGNY